MRHAAFLLLREREPSVQSCRHLMRISTYCALGSLAWHWGVQVNRINNSDLQNL